MLAVVERGESPPLLLLVQTAVGAGEDVFGGIGRHLAMVGSWHRVHISHNA